jgi:hypothetical protein
LCSVSLHPIDEDLSLWTAHLHPIDEDLSMGTPHLLASGRGASSSRTSPPKVNSSKSNPAATGSSTAPIPFIVSLSRFIFEPPYRAAIMT